MQGQKLRKLWVEFLNHPIYCHLKMTASDSRTQEFLFLFGQKQIYFHRLRVRNNFILFRSYFAIKSSPSDESKLREFVKSNRITHVWSPCTCGLGASLVAWINHGCNQRGAAVSGSLQTPGTALLRGNAVCSGESAPFQCHCSAAALQCFKSGDK